MPPRGAATTKGDAQKGGLKKTPSYMDKIKGKAQADPRDPLGLLAGEFAFIDLNENKVVTPDELHAALFIAGWDYDAVYGIFTAVDKDEDGKLSRDEWIDYRCNMPQATEQERKWVAEVKSKGMGVDPMNKVKEIMTKYDDDKDGALNQRELAKYVRTVNDEEGVLNDNEFGLYVKESLEDFDADKDKALNAAEFLPFFKRFSLKVAAGRITEEKRREAKELKEKGIMPPYTYCNDTSKFSGDAAWQCNMQVKDELMDAIRCAWNKKKTPLLIDATATDRDDPKPTPLDEFFGGAYRGMDAQMSYSGKGRYEFLDLKQCVLDVSLKKAQQSSCAKDWSTVQRELRQRVVKSMQDGDVLVLQMGTACPPLLSSIFHPDFFPPDLLDSKKAQSVRGHDSSRFGSSWAGRMINKEDKLAQIDEDWNVMAITKFQSADYHKFLQSEVPLDLCQSIIVTIAAPVAS